MAERITITVRDGVGEKLVELAGSSRKQGDYLSGLIQAVWENNQAPANEELNVEGLRLQILGLAGQHRQLEGRVLRIEHRLSASSGADRFSQMQ